MLYNKYSDFLKKKYGEKIYKIPINLPVTCPNRIDRGEGCTFCSEKAINSEMLPNTKSVKEQLDENITYISPRYSAKKFIAYFQNATNTFLPFDKFDFYINQVTREDIVGISLSTRPDCIASEYLEMLQKYSQKTKKNINIELGLQTVNYKTLKKIARGHSLGEFIDSVLLIKKYDFTITVHMILNLPYDDIDDVIEGAKVLSSLGINFVKMHSLYIAKDTKMGDDYLSGKIHLDKVEDYVEKVSTFLSYLHPDIVVERLVSRAPKEETLFCNYDTSWWKIRDYIVEYMEKNSLYQGCKCDYLQGKNVRRFKRDCDESRRNI